MTNPKEMKLVFAPGCFDSFEGSQEELEEMEKKFNELKAQAEQSGSSTTNPE